MVWTWIIVLQCRKGVPEYRVISLAARDQGRQRLLALLDGQPGIVVSRRPGQLMLLIRLAFAHGRIVGIEATNDPEKMRATQISIV